MAARWVWIVLLFTAVPALTSLLDAASKGSVTPQQPGKQVVVPPAPALSPAEEMKTFKIVPGYRASN